MLFSVIRSTVSNSVTSFSKKLIPLPFQNHVPFFFIFVSSFFHLILFCLSFNSCIQIYSLFSLYYEIFMFWMKTQTIEIFPLFIKCSFLYNSLNVFQTMKLPTPAASCPFLKSALLSPPPRGFFL